MRRIVKPCRTRAAKAALARLMWRSASIAPSATKTAMIAVTVGLAAAHDHSNAGIEGSSGTRGSTCWVSAKTRIAMPKTASTSVSTIIAARIVGVVDPSSRVRVRKILTRSPPRAGAIAFTPTPAK